MVASGLLTGAVLAQVAISFPGSNGAPAPGWNGDNQGQRTLYMTAFDKAGAELPATVVAGLNRAGEMVKATMLAESVQMIADVGTKTILDVTNPQYGTATVELALPAVHDVMVDLVFVAPGRVEATVHGQTLTLSNAAPGGVAVADPACPGDGDCCAPGGNGTPGCDDVDCCNLVCDTIDPFCCDTAWDSLCASTAVANCDVCQEPSCPLDCPPGALDEGEPCLVDEDTDVTNGGCNSTPPVFTDAACGDTFCGMISTYLIAGGQNRDTDWYMVNHPGGTISGTLVSQFPGVCFIVSGVGPGGNPCAPVVEGNIGCSADCANIQVASASLPAGPVVVFVSSGDCAGGGIFSGIPCGAGNDYVLTIDCEGPCQTDDDCPAGQICVDGICIIPPPENDTCDTAVPLDVGPGGSVDISGTTINATVDGVSCVTSTTAPGVWYTVTGTGNTMTASTCNQADYDTKISVWCGMCPAGGGGSDCCVANGTPGCDDPACEAAVCSIDPFCCDVAWDSICAGEAATLCAVCAPSTDFVCVDGVDDSSGCGLTTEVTWCSQAGAQYYIMVHGFSSATGNFTLTVSDNGTACSGAVECPFVCETDDDCPPGFVCIDGACVEVPTGACCQCDEMNMIVCTIETEMDCMALDGLYLGDGSNCEAGGNVETYTSSPGLAIPDDTAPGIFDTISVGDSFNVLDIQVALDITHTWAGDLCVSLDHGGNSQYIIQRMNLAAPLDTCDGNNCCGCSSDNLCCTLWDGAADGIDDQCGWSGCLSGTFYSQGFNLSSFVGMDSAGDWTLGVNDNAAGDTGTLNSWSLMLTAPASGLSPCEEAGFSCNEPPDCSGAYASVGELWPPNHSWEMISIEGVTDPDGDPVTITITSIWQDEDPEGLGSGNTCPDAMGVGSDTAQVRAERSGLGDGRVYHIAFTADDGQGGMCDGEVTVCVPHDQSDGCIDGGPLFDSTACGMMGTSFNQPSFGGPGD